VIRLTVGGVILGWRCLNAEKGRLGWRPSVSYWDLFDFEDGWWSWDRYGGNRYAWREEYSDPNLWGCLLCIGFGVAFLISTGFALGEARYWAFGHTAQASVIRASSPDETDDAFLIRYGFTDAKTQNYREEVDAVPSRWGPPPDVMAVEYIPGRTGVSRVAGNHRWVALGFFALTSLGLLGGLAWLYRDARRAFEPYHAHHHGHDSHDPHRHAYDLAGYTTRTERPGPRGHWFPNS
jgi:hypothetical protein